MKCSVCLVFVCIILLPGVAGMSCRHFDNSYSCVLEFGVNIDDKLSGEVVFEYDFSDLLDRKYLCLDEEIEVGVNVLNGREDNYEIEVYSYAYKGSSCLSCGDGQRETNMVYGVVTSGEAASLITRIVLLREGDGFVKLRHREKGKKTWIDNKKKIDVVNCSNLVDKGENSGSLSFNMSHENSTNVLLVSAEADFVDDNLINKSERISNFSIVNVAFDLNESRDLNGDMKEFNGFGFRGIVVVLGCFGVVLLFFVVFGYDNLKAKLFK